MDTFYQEGIITDDAGIEHIVPEGSIIVTVDEAEVSPEEITIKIRLVRLQERDIQRVMASFTGTFMLEGFIFDEDLRYWKKIHKGH